MATLTVAQYIAKQPSPQKEILMVLRALILATVPKIHEEVKMGVPWYEGKFYLVSLRDHVNMGFAVSELSREYRAQLFGKGKYMRHLKFKVADEINVSLVKKFIVAICKN